MSPFLQILYLAVMATLVAAATLALCRNQQLSRSKTLHEAVTWVTCFVLSAGIDYFIIVPGSGYTIAVS